MMIFLDLISTFSALVMCTAIVSVSSYFHQTRDRTNECSVILNPSLRALCLNMLQPLEKLCIKCGIKPAHLSFAQLAGTFLVAYCYATGLFLAGGCLLLLTGMFDVMDGRVARRANSASARGAFLDSVIDRYADSLSYLGLAVFFRETWVLWAVLPALIGSLIVSYARARAEGLGTECKIGLLQRAERYIILGFGTVIGGIGFWVHGEHFVVVIIVILAVLVNFTAIQRTIYVWQMLGRVPAERI